MVRHWQSAVGLAVLGSCFYRESKHMCGSNVQKLPKLTPQPGDTEEYCYSQADNEDAGMTGCLGLAFDTSSFTTRLGGPGQVPSLPGASVPTL